MILDGRFWVCRFANEHVPRADDVCTISGVKGKDLEGTKTGVET